MKFFWLPCVVFVLWSSIVVVLLVLALLAFSS